MTDPLTDEDVEYLRTRPNAVTLNGQDVRAGLFATIDSLRSDRAALSVQVDRLDDELAIAADRVHRAELKVATLSVRVEEAEGERDVQAGLYSEAIKDYYRQKSARSNAEEQVRQLSEVVEGGPEWHSKRFPDATMERVALKLAEEAGEVCAAVIAMAGGEHPERAGDVVAECADVFIVLSVLVGRYFPFTPLFDAVRDKLAALARLQVDSEGEN